ncbi:DUF4345 domain-containing protein [Flammeovirga aprica]|uniref:DUF4345 domain-containing protein n=1 Tax=Flammeovirga aprica JL-4 TaxID=694437 RepID=A0A7X9RZV9_9BACT|nr:DUF4345 domain-containing protein [Flammeovirga aprica]NME71820.1 DUF4345 domain-containing protein [Flammeovirga aprica JL-4]
MKNSKIIAVFLSLSAIVGLYVGGNLLFSPAALQAEHGIIIESASQFNETRAPGAALLFSTFFIILGVFKLSWRKNALFLAALLFNAYGFGRLLSYFVDGRPADGLVDAMIGEFIFGFIALFFYIKTKREEVLLKVD